MTATRRLAVTAFALLLAAPFAVACSEETKDSARETADQLEDDAQRNADELGTELDEKADEGQARAAAEDLRVRIKANETASTQGPRSMTAISESAVDVAGDPEIVGAADADGDGLDDDGKVQVNVGGASACVTLPATGDDTSVEGGAC
jgi:hypothetical protein